MTNISSSKFTAVGRQDSKIRYAVDRYDPRFGFLLIKIQSHDVAGSSQAFERPKPRQQAAISEAWRLVEPGEFAHQRVLVVGGSRGMGETVAKLLASGGADVRITYFQGAEDAERVVLELRLYCPTAECIQLDVTDIGVDGFAGLGDWCPTDLYYFTTH